jgi:hypothetical protein
VSRLFRYRDSAELVHARQHEDQELSGVFFADAGIDAPKCSTGICGQARRVQMGRMIDQLGSLFATAGLAT